jgi:hypothetical protein
MILYLKMVKYRIKIQGQNQVGGWVSGGITGFKYCDPQ